ncbi:MAG: 1-deoxy-D-xylulose-5-phosphate reductoisomerase [Rickettsiales bacterium]|nr:1-deoxy-D-xylulose-5-phosphate reductoisomerase [Rickettsiales bacterium]
MNTTSHLTLAHTAQPRTITVLGATGSVGSTTLSLVRQHRSLYAIEALTAQDNVEALIALALEFAPSFVAIGNPAHHARLKEALAGTSIATGSGPQSLLDAAARPADWTIASIIGIAGLRPTLEAIRRGGVIALANKESLVAAGALVMRECAQHKVTLLPVDSEHNAVFQLIEHAKSPPIKITLTASGGPFRQFTKPELAAVTPAQAVKHPNWSMGAKISVDSATLMNKGLELIEAQHLFALNPEQFDVLVHPQSIIHCLVHYEDGAVLAQLSHPDMAVPIAFAMAWPSRMATACKPLDLAAMGRLDFDYPDEDRFPCLRLARSAMKAGGDAPLVLNTANEVAVARFLNGEISFPDIATMIEHAMAISTGKTPQSLEEVIEIDHTVRSKLSESCGL